MTKYDHEPIYQYSDGLHADVICVICGEYHVDYDTDALDDFMEANSTGWRTGEPPEDISDVMVWNGFCHVIAGRLEKGGPMWVVGSSRSLDPGPMRWNPDWYWALLLPPPGGKR